MPQSRRHHWVSQFYLRRFTANQERPLLFVVDFAGMKSFETKPENVAQERDFHAIDVPGRELDAVEKEIAKFESTVAPALDRVIGAQALDNTEDRLTLFFFATLLLLKNPYMRRKIDDIANTVMQTIQKHNASSDQAWEAITKEYVENGIFGSRADADKIRLGLLNDEYSFSLTTDAHMDMEFTNAPQLLRFLEGRQWNIYRAIEGQFVTCDRPAALIWADPRCNDPIGLSLKNTRVLFPLSSEIAINGGFELKDRVVDLGAEDVAKVNGRLILNAGRQVYARDDSFEYALPHNGVVKRGVDILNDDFAKRKADHADNA